MGSTLRRSGTKEDYGRLQTQKRLVGNLKDVNGFIRGKREKSAIVMSVVRG